MLCRGGVGEALFGREQVSVVDRTYVALLGHGKTNVQTAVTNHAIETRRSLFIALDVSLLAISTSFSRLRVTDALLHSCGDIVRVAMDPTETGVMISMLAW